MKFKIALYFLLAVLMSFRLVGATNAFYIDGATTNQNSISAAQLDISLLDANNLPVEEPFLNISDFKPNQTYTNQLKIKNNGTISAMYKAVVIPTSADVTLCKALDIEVLKDGISEYQGSLLSFSSSGVLSASSLGSYEFKLNLAETAKFLENSSCHFSLRFDAWQSDSDGTWGFTDSQSITNSVSSGDWTAPLISNIITSPYNDFDPVARRYDISWDTDEAATGNLVWGKTSAYGYSAPLIEDTLADKVQHSISLSGLDYDTLYHFQIKAKDTAGNESLSQDLTFSTPKQQNSIKPLDVVLNEIMYNPAGPESASMPNGEWVELYNNTETDIDASGWKVKDLIGNTITVSKTNSDNNNNTTDAGETVVPAKGWLVVYRNGTPYFNNGNETIFLYFGTLLMDSHSYHGSKQNGQTEARIPDGVGNWVDPIPTPGKMNLLEERNSIVTDLSLYYLPGEHGIGFSLTGNGLKEFTEVEYEITYYTNNIQQQIQGTLMINGEDQLGKNDFIFGTCSSGGTCRYEPNISDIHLKVTLKGTFERGLTAVLD